MNPPMNPMIRKELRLLMRERRGWVLPSLYLVALGALAMFAYFESMRRENGTVLLEGPDIGIPVFLTVVFAQLSVLLLLVPVFSAGSFTIEKEQRTLPGLFTSLLTDAQIWWGKFLSSLMFVLLLLVAGLPVIALTFAFGGIGIWEMFMVTVTTVIILACFSAVGLYWSSVFRRSVPATAVTYGTVIVLSAVTAILFFAQLSESHNAPWYNLPLRAKAPILANPFFFLAVSLTDPPYLYPEWVLSALLFVFVGTVAIFLTLRNLRRERRTS